MKEQSPDYRIDESNQPIIDGAFDSIQNKLNMFEEENSIPLISGYTDEGLFIHVRELTSVESGEPRFVVFSEFIGRLAMNRRLNIAYFTDAQATRYDKGRTTIIPTDMGTIYNPTPDINRLPSIGLDTIFPFPRDASLLQVDLQ